jgi:hypothetical protein
VIRPPPTATLFIFFDGKHAFDMVFQSRRDVDCTFFRTGIALLLHRSIPQYILQFTPNLQYHAISAQLQSRHIIESGMLAAVLQWPHRCM